MTIKLDDHEIEFLKNWVLEPWVSLDEGEALIRADLLRKLTEIEDEDDKIKILPLLRR